MTPGYFAKQTCINAPVNAVFAWHARPGAIERLSPPWDPIRLISQSGGIRPGARVVLEMRAGPIKYKWQAEHTVYRENEEFVDEQKRGPFSAWTHRHCFEPAGKQACWLKDRIHYQLPWATLSHPLAGPIIQRQLARIFAYRHRVTVADMALQEKFASLPRRTILISGASGLLGARLIPLLTTGGHRVIKLVRRQPAHSDEIFWDPAQDRIDDRALAKETIDAVIHLAGENVGTGRWTAAKKKAIIHSRENGTALLARAISRLNHRPEAFLSASAVGLYGHRGEARLTETDAPGHDFLAEVCQRWETAALTNLHGDIRPVLMRIGVVLSPEGGALQKLLLPFKLGLGGRIGHGRQYLSWITLDDALGAIYQALMHTPLKGPVNLVAPQPVTNRNFTQTLAGVLSRPAALPVPAGFINLLFGQMGREVLLTSTRVHPSKLLETGFQFGYPELATGLRHLLGKD